MFLLKDNFNTKTCAESSLISFFKKNSPVIVVGTLSVVCFGLSVAKYDWNYPLKEVLETNKLSALLCGAGCLGFIPFLWLMKKNRAKKILEISARSDKKVEKEFVKDNNENIPENDLQESKESIILPRNTDYEKNSEIITEDKERKSEIEKIAELKKCARERYSDYPFIFILPYFLNLFYFC